ncbi:MAG: hypothetical protein EOO04_26490 [Chitinophagaceae bacterium]|nr:MAG: hypothetical protein EOO04_26490 [Chitinophagaceae bacterium]
MITSTNTPGISDYLALYQYLSVLTEEQIIKLRRIAVGILPLSAFTEDEVKLLASKQLEQLA